MADDPLLVFDLDDTLYTEASYARSALRFVGGEMTRLFGITDQSAALIAAFNQGQSDVIGRCVAENRLPADAKADLLTAMHAHRPDIALRPDAARLIAALRKTGRRFAIVTDGRSLTQRAKISALGCDDASHISVSGECELAKTDVKRWLAVEAAVPAPSYCYIADNPEKDFLVPNLLNWRTVMLKADDNNIYSQKLPEDARYHPARTICSLDELLP